MLVLVVPSRLLVLQASTDRDPDRSAHSDAEGEVVHQQAYGNADRDADRDPSSSVHCPIILGLLSLPRLDNMRRAIRRSVGPVVAAGHRA